MIFVANNSWSALFSSSNCSINLSFNKYMLCAQGMSLEVSICLKLVRHCCIFCVFADCSNYIWQIRNVIFQGCLGDFSPGYGVFFVGQTGISYQSISFVENKFDMEIAWINKCFTCGGANNFPINFYFLTSVVVAGVCLCCYWQQSIAVDAYESKVVLMYNVY